MNTPTLTLNDENVIPQLGLGSWQATPDEVRSSLLEALKVGYRLIDTAQIYQNEEGVGAALKESGLNRDEIFVVTKIWNTEHAHDATLRSFDVSMKKLGLEKLDLLLIHWPSPHRGQYAECWKALVELQKQGRVKSIGVSNFHETHLNKIIQETGVTPAVNQIELHPHFQQLKLQDFHAKHEIQTMSWSPLGQGQVLKDQTISKIAHKHKKTPAQVILRWHLDQELIVIPKSVHPERIRENFNVFDFELDSEDLATIEKLDRTDGRIGPNPETAEF